MLLNTVNIGVYLKQTEHPNMKIIIGIDPGTNGGIAWITSDGKACVEKMPDTHEDEVDAVVGLAKKLKLKLWNE